jgi:CBS domain-containing protein
MQRTYRYVPAPSARLLLPVPPMERPAVPVIADFMTPAPHVIAPDAPLPRAQALMREHAVRHLPVMRGEQLVGIVSDRDIALVQCVTRRGADEFFVRDAMTRDPYVAAQDTPLTKVAREMVDRKIGSAVVLEGTRVAGVFTVTDALEALIEVLDGTFVRRVYEGVPTEPAESRHGRDVH